MEGAEVVIVDYDADSACHATKRVGEAEAWVRLDAERRHPLPPAVFERYWADAHK